MHTLSSTPDLIVHHAQAHTQDPRLPHAEAVAVRGGRILAVGSSDEVVALAGAGTRLVDAGGATLLPGFCDAHIHFGDYSLNLTALPLAAATSRAALLEMLAARAGQTPPGGWIVGRGWNESRWGESAFPTAAELDAATGPDRPALLYRSDLHSAVANSAALRAAGIDAATPDPDDGSIDRDAAGRPTGVLREGATGLVAQQVPPTSSALRIDAMRLGIRTLHRLGITAIHDQRYGGSSRGEPEGATLMRAFDALRRSGELGLRVSCNVAAAEIGHLAALGLATGFGDDRLRTGHVKLFADGSLGSRTAWMIDPFAAQPGETAANYGVVVTPPDEMSHLFHRARAAGCSISVHAIGDRALREVLDVFEELAAVDQRPAVPHRIEHVQTLHPDDCARLAQLGLTASVQPIHALDDMDTADLLLGERAARAYVFRTLLEAGTRLAFGSDAPVADPNPWLGLHAAVVRQRPERAGGAPWHGEQRISLEEAVRAYTLGAAEAGGWQETIGSVTPGKRADLVLLDRDLFALAPDAREAGALAQAQVRMTIFDGEVVYEA